MLTHGELSLGLEVAYEDEGISIQPFSEREIESGLCKKIREKLEADPNLICVTLDRFLPEGIEDEFPERFFRLSITRRLDGKKIPRFGFEPTSTQIENILSRPDNESRFLIVGDGIFTGGTVGEIIGLLTSLEIETEKIETIIGFIGNENSDIQGIPTEIIKRIKNLSEWIDIRDFGIFGGKVFRTNKKNSAGTTVPYLYQWSDGSGASFDKMQNFKEISREMILELIKLISEFEKLAKITLTFRDLAKAGFGIPVSVEVSLPPNKPILEYLNCIIDEFFKEPKDE